jgi:hypothetical protein
VLHDQSRTKETIKGLQRQKLADKEQQVRVENLVTQQRQPALHAPVRTQGPAGCAHMLIAATLSGARRRAAWAHARSRRERRAAIEAVHERLA